MNIITDNFESKEIDKVLMNEYNIPEIILIESAMNSFINHIDLTKEKYIIACGPGNNGADGLCLAKLLISKNKNVKIICKENKSIYYEICKKMNIEFIDKIENCDILIDAVFGVGLVGEVKGYYKNLIEEINTNKNYMIVSIDVPSPNINSDLVIMLSSYKESMLNNSTESKVIDIGISQKYYENISNKYLIDESYIKSITKKRDIFANKSMFGKVAIYAKKGAALMTSCASIKSGSGYTLLLSDYETIQANLIYNPECLNYEVEYIHNSEVIAIGPNFSNDEELKYVFENYIDKKFVIDADAINYIANNKEIIKKLNEYTVLTPHPLEFSRISGFKLDYILKHPFEALKRFKTQYKGCVVLKAKNNIIYDGINYYVINIGNSKMANAGMGDVLTGMIASYIAQKYTVLDACILATYRQAQLGNEISKYKAVVNPRDILNNL